MKELTHPMLSPTPPMRMKRGKIVSAKEAARVIRDGDIIATGGFVGTGFAEEIAIKLEEYFLKTGKPRGPTLIYAAGQGDGVERGLNHLAHEGLIKRVIRGHWGLAPKLYTDERLQISGGISSLDQPFSKNRILL